MAPRDRDPLSELAAGFLRGQGPVNLDEALSVLALLAGAGGRSRGGEPPAPAFGPPQAAGILAGAETRQLRLAEARYRALVEQIPAVVFLASMEGGLGDIYVSPQIEALLGFTQEEWTSSPVLWFRQLHPGDRGQLSTAFARACVTGQPFRGILRVFARDGRLVWVHAEARLVHDEGGRPIFLHGVAFDITEQQQAQQTRQQLLLEQQARAEADRERTRLQEMFVSLPTAVAVVSGPDHLLEFLNPVALQVAGLREDALGRPWREAFTGLPDATPVLDRVYRSGTVFSARDLPLRSPRWDGERFFDVVCQPLRGPDGEVSGLLVHAVEVTEQRRAQAAAEAATGRASFLARLSHALGTSLDSAAVLDTVSKQVVPELADWTTLDVVQEDGTIRTVATFHRDAARAELAARLHRLDPAPLDSLRGVARAIRTGQVELAAHVDEAYLGASTPDPERRRLLRELGLGSCVVIPLRVRARVHGALTLAREAPGGYGPADLPLADEVGLRTGLAMDNASLYREAQDASRLRDEFLATLSHELRTPLNSIVGWAHILRESAAPSSPEVAKAVETIVRNAHIQNQLISDILDVSRIIAGKLALSVRVVDFAAVIQAAVDTVRPAAQAKQIRLQAILDRSAGPVSGDPDRLQQVVWNLVSNAIKFAPRGGRVQVRLEAVNSHVELSVEDDGPGIDPAFLPFVFERFRQADSSSSRRHGGLGLGLAIARHLVELHGGMVEASNLEGGRGALFRVRLPRRSVVSVPGDVAERHPGAAGVVWLDTAPSLEGITVLVVDDDGDARELVVKVLERCGARAQAVATAAEALERVRQRRFDVLLADIEMPGEDGYELIRKVRALPPEQGGRIPAAALTAYASTQDRVKVLASGFHMHVPKPAQPAELAAVVASLAGRTGTGPPGQI